MIRLSVAAATLLVVTSGLAVAIELQPSRPRPDGTDASAFVARPTLRTYPGVGTGPDRQLGALVFGLEADAGTLDTVADRSVWDGQTYHSEFGGGFGAVRGLAGHAFGSALFYGTGGLAVGNVRFDDNDGRSPRTGWVAGGGAEAALTANLSGRIEFLRLNFGNFRDAGGGSESYAVKTTVDMWRVGFNYRF